MSPPHPGSRPRPRRLQSIAGIGVDRMGNLADRSRDPAILRLENLDTDLPLPKGVVEATRRAVGRDDANSYLPFLGADALRAEAAALVSRLSGRDYDWNKSTIICTGGLNGILNSLLALLEPGDEVLMTDPIYIGLINRVRLASGVPKFVDCEVVDGAWKLNLESLHRAITPKTKVFLMMSPAMPSGAVFSRRDWQVICEACIENDAWMLYNSAMERILFDGAEHIHPASFDGMEERTITVGSVSKEYRMIGWRVGWIVAPESIVDDIGLVNISNVVCNVGIAQDAAAVALREPDSDLGSTVAELEWRRNVILEECADLPLVRPAGGWSLLLDTTELKLDSKNLSQKLFAEAGIAATPMEGWGRETDHRFLRFVFSNEPVERLTGIRERIGRVL